jgi:hypothetical protein
MFRNVMQTPFKASKIARYRSTRPEPEGGRMIAKAWDRQTPEIRSTSAAVIDFRSKLYEEVRATYWNILAHEHDSLTEEAGAARQACVKAAQQLRRSFDSHPTAGPDAADAMIAWAVHYARKDFAKDLQLDTN